jgi:hypothetical protein
MSAYVSGSAPVVLVKAGFARRPYVFQPECSTILSVGCTLAYDVLSSTANFTFNILANRDPFQ